jgi:hypothetical protein
LPNRDSLIYSPVVIGGVDSTQYWVNSFINALTYYPFADGDSLGFRTTTDGTLEMCGYINCVNPLMLPGRTGTEYWGMEQPPDVQCAYGNNYAGPGYAVAICRNGDIWSVGYLNNYQGGLNAARNTTTWTKLGNAPQFADRDMHTNRDEPPIRKCIATETSAMILLSDGSLWSTGTTLGGYGAINGKDLADCHDWTQIYLDGQPVSAIDFTKNGAGFSYITSSFKTISCASHPSGWAGHTNNTGAPILAFDGGFRIESIYSDNSALQRGSILGLQNSSRYVCTNHWSTSMGDSTFPVDPDAYVSTYSLTATVAMSKTINLGIDADGSVFAFGKIGSTYIGRTTVYVPADLGGVRPKRLFSLDATTAMITRNGYLWQGGLDLYCQSVHADPMILKPILVDGLHLLNTPRPESLAAKGKDHLTGVRSVAIGIPVPLTA